MKRKYYFLLLLLLPIYLFASSRRALAVCTINGQNIPCDQFWSKYGVTFGLIFIPLIIFGIVGGIFWVLMLIDCIKRDLKTKSYGL